MTCGQVSRRGLLAAGAVGIGALVAGCGRHSDTESGQRRWSFVDDRGKKVVADKRPQRIIAYVGTAAALYDLGLGDRIVGVFGPTRLKDGKPDQQAGNLDISRVTILGNAWGEFDIEKYASLRPDLLVTNMYEKNSLWFVPDDSKQKILKLAPCIALNTAHVSLPKPMHRYLQLAQELGADLSAKAVTQAKSRYEAAVTALRAAAGGNRQIKVLAGSASRDLFYVSDPRVYADLSYFRDLGVDFVVPNKVTGGFFENLSWEQANKYPADLIMLDDRTAGLQPKDLKSNPTWTSLPAVRAGQITPWLSEPRFSYAGLAPRIELLAKAVRSAHKVS